MEQKKTRRTKKVKINESTYMVSQDKSGEYRDEL
ncbi:uncharacterized protein G2W53_024986 [Senna tora]|uniref:Uncharacterized protein n=1 Tax=Senna tora TaxID=362788 RepID=A0A834WHG4_9FABA|nr:uncharacterized protein G2W53_024986 [Senna tora]